MHSCASAPEEVCSAESRSAYLLRWVSAAHTHRRASRTSSVLLIKLVWLSGQTQAQHMPSLFVSCLQSIDGALPSGAMHDEAHKIGHCTSVARKHAPAGVGLIECWQRTLETGATRLVLIVDSEELELGMSAVNQGVHRASAGMPVPGPFSRSRSCVSKVHNAST